MSEKAYMLLTNENRSLKQELLKSKNAATGEYSGWLRVERLMVPDLGKIIGCKM